MEKEQTISWQRLLAIKPQWQAAIYLACLVTDELRARLVGKMMKSSSILNLLSECMIQNIHKWGKEMHITDAATLDYSMALDASSLIVLAYVGKQTKLLWLWNKSPKRMSFSPCVFYFLYLYCLSMVNHSGQHLILTILLLVFLSGNIIQKKKHLPALGYNIISWARMFTNPLNNPSPVTVWVIYSLNL